MVTKLKHCYSVVYSFPQHFSGFLPFLNPSFLPCLLDYTGFLDFATYSENMYKAEEG